MKRKTIIHASIAGTAMAFMVAGTIAGISLFEKKVENVNAASEFSSSSLPTSIDLNDCTDSEIKNYYSALSNKSSSELSGTNLLKNLKSIISNNISYYSYSTVSEVYVITDRDWTNSPATAMSGYNASTKTISSFSHSTEVSNNPYLHLLYCDYDVQGKTLYQGDGDVNSSSVSFDKEHCWSQSHGFDNGTSSGQNLTGAGSDLHHLKAGTQYGNRTLHSNYSYGFVKANDGDWSSKPYERNNKRGAPLFSHSEDQQTKVFEPQDCDKGDIARALLYLVACYNNYDGSTPTPANPALKLVNYVISGSTTGYSSENLTNGYYGILQDILAWHKLDPVDSYEIHRNNLIFRNYQHNRNPFIDFPEWVDYIWGTAEYNSSNKTISYNSASTGYVNLNEDVINGYRANARQITKIEVTHQPDKTSYYVDENFDKTGMVVTATYDDNSTQDVTNYCTVSVDMSSAGNKTVTVTYNGKTATTTITVLPNTANVSSVSLNKTSATIGVGDKLTLTATVLPINAANKNINWSSSNTSVATINDGQVTGVAAGTATITATSAENSSIKATCAITVKEATPTIQMTDTLVLSDTKRTGTSYGDWSNVTKSSGAVYAGNSSGYNSAITIRTSNSNSGIFTTASGGTLKKVTLVWNSKSATGRDVNVYGKNTAYTSASELFDSNNQGTLLGTIVNGESTELTITGEYTFVGLKSTDSNLSLDSISFLWEQESTSDEVPVTGVSFDNNSASVAKGSTIQLTSTVLPNEATNKDVTYSSSLPSVATVSSTGLVTGVSVGTCIITVETDDGGFTDECTITVTNSSTGSTYYERQTNISSLTDGQYVICAKVGNDYFPMGTYVSSNYIASTSTITVADNKISETNASSYIVTVKNNGSDGISIKLNSTRYLTYGTSGTQLNANTEESYWTLSSGTKGTFRLTDSTSERCLAYSVQTTSRFAAYTSTTIEGYDNYYDLEFFKYTQGSGSYTLDNFVEDFLKGITCDSTGANAPTFKTGYSWAELKAKYQSLTTAEQNELKTYVADANGNDEAKCVARYDYIVGKYGINTYENFMNRTIVSHSNRLGNAVISNNAMLLLVVMAALGTFTFAAWFIHKKKQYDL